MDGSGDESKTDDAKSIHRGNPLRRRTDFQQAVRDLFDPLGPYYEKGGARVILGNTATLYGEAAEGLEAFTRP